MSLSSKQIRFTELLGVFLTIISAKNKYSVTLGEAYRTKYQQLAYIKNGKSKAKISQHQNRLAVDLNLFIDGEYKIDSRSYAPLGAIWKSLDKKCVWGGDWGWDANHFEYKM